MNQFNTLHPMQEIRSIEELFGNLFNLPTATKASPPPAPPVKKVFEYIFAFGNEGYSGEVQVTENYYTEDEFCKVADEVGATSYEPVEFTRRERDRTLN